MASFVSTVAIQNPELEKEERAMVELCFESKGNTTLETMDDYVWEEPVQLYQMVEVDPKYPVRDQIAWLTGYLSQYLQANFIGWCPLAFNPVDLDWIDEF